VLMVQISIRRGERLLSRRVRDAHWSIDVDARPRRSTICPAIFVSRCERLRTFLNCAKQNFALGTVSNKSVGMT